MMQDEEKKSAASDAALLRRFARQGRQAAFSELVSRYSGLVYSTCLRDIRNAAVAEDAAQAVFLLLARKAPTFGAGTSLAGWLYRTARLVSRNAVQQETRTRLREQRLGQHMVVEGINGGAENELWDQLEPVLHNALDALGRQEREAILLRFFDDRSLKEIGAALGLSEDAARMRVSRSLEKLRRYLAKNGVVLSAAALSGLLTGKAVHAAPASLGQLASQAAAGIAAPAGSAAISRAYQLAQGAMKTMWITKAIITGLVGISATSGVVGALHIRRPHPPMLAQNTLVQARPAASFGATASSAQAVMAQAAAATGALQSLHSGLTWTLSAKGKSATVTGSLALQRPNFARRDLVEKNGNHIWEVADGTFTWDFSPGTHKLYKELDAPDGRDIGGNTTEVFASFFFDPSLMGLRVEPDTTDPAVRYIGEQTWRGGHYQVVELKREAKDGQIKHTILAFFGADHLLHRVLVTTFFDDGMVMTEETYLSNTKPDAPIAAQQFVMVQPKNAILVDTAKLQVENAEAERRHQAGQQPKP